MNFTKQPHSVYYYSLFLCSFLLSTPVIAIEGSQSSPQAVFNKPESSTQNTQQLEGLVPKKLELKDLIGKRVLVTIPNAPDYYPTFFKKVGVLRNKKAGRLLTISGINYYYGINVKVHTLTSKFSTINALSTGSTLGFNYIQDEAGNNFLIEAWVLPDNVSGPVINDR